MKLALLAGVCVLSLCVNAADAAVVYDFVVAPILGATGTPIPGFEGAVDGRTFTFSISTDESPTTGLPFNYPNYRIKSYSYTEFGSTTPVIVPATLGKNIVFLGGQQQPGLSLTNSGNRNFFLYNSYLYDSAAYQAAILSDPAADPIFNLGTILLSTIPRNGAAQRPLDNYSVTISIEGAAAAVPEPASWAMMVGGFGLLGGALRRRRTTTAVTFA